MALATSWLAKKWQLITSQCHLRSAESTVMQPQARDLMMVNSLMKWLAALGWTAATKVKFSIGAWLHDTLIGLMTWTDDKHDWHNLILSLSSHCQWWSAGENIQFPIPCDPVMCRVYSWLYPVTLVTCAIHLIDPDIDTMTEMLGSTFINMSVTRGRVTRVYHPCIVRSSALTLYFILAVSFVTPVIQRTKQ